MGVAIDSSTEEVFRKYWQGFHARLTEAAYTAPPSRRHSLSSAERRGGGVDVLYEDGVRQALFNGEPKAQKLSSTQYDAKLSEADARYTRLLEVLTEALHQTPALVTALGA